MKKYFITSDIHSFYSEFITALSKAHFDIDNKDHILIICGDIFDRGDEAIQLYNWLKQLPSDRKILIRGNHEYLLLDLIRRTYPLNYDFSNGTWKTYCDLNNNNLIDEIYKWINSDSWINYYELNNYIFVHSFIPLTYNNKKSGSAISYNKNWRKNATERDWIQASWECPWKQFLDGMFNEEIKNKKILVCGHWHTSDFYNVLDNKSYKLTENPIYTSSNLIALDACTALTHKINIFVVDI